MPTLQVEAFILAALIRKTEAKMCTTPKMLRIQREGSDDSFGGWAGNGIQKPTETTPSNSDAVPVTRYVPGDSDSGL